MLWYAGLGLAALAAYLWWRNQQQSATPISNPEVVAPDAAASGSGSLVPAGPGYPYYTGQGQLAGALSGQQTSDPALLAGSGYSWAPGSVS